ncbi:50S ribosomal protein L23 [Candidatus Kaiserbacteria bacterium]|nr:50S ribosomal protein L23 [Candidatus Kaiserbacteria bacterium]
MALFGKKDAKTSDANGVSKSVSPTAKQLGRDLSHIIVRPRITEKAALGIDRNVYTFEIHKDAGKHDVRDAVRALYNVTPVKVNIVKKTPRHYLSRARGRKMMEKGLKKAYVYLKEGDRIDLA